MLAKWTLLSTEPPLDPLSVYSRQNCQDQAPALWHCRYSDGADRYDLCAHGVYLLTEDWQGLVFRSESHTTIQAGCRVLLSHTLQHWARDLHQEAPPPPSPLLGLDGHQ